jgi:hypothetical protein
MARLGGFPLRAKHGTQGDRHTLWRRNNVAQIKQPTLQFIVSTVFLLMCEPANSQQAQGGTPPAISLPVPIIAAPSPQLPVGLPTEPAPISVPNIPLDSVRTDMLEKDRADLADMLAGRWDNELQTFFEPELNVPLAQRHDRLHTVIRPLEAGAFGPNAFYVEYRGGGEAGPVVRQRVWILSVDPGLAALRLATFSPKDGKAIEGAWRDPARLSALRPADFVPVAGCDIIWRRRADGFSGETRPGACKITTTGAAQRVLTISERHDLSPATWDVRDIGVDDRGVRAFGSADNAPTRLRRVVPFVCWAGVTRGSEPMIVSDLIVHDQGGVATATLAGLTPSSVTLRLRNVDWPIGQNRPSLTLYVMTGTDPAAKGYAWSEPDAKRIAIDVGGTQASCTRDERAVWR